MNTPLTRPFKPFLSSAFVIDLMLFNIHPRKPLTLEQRLQAMTFCELCAEFSSDAMLAAEGADYGCCEICGAEQWGFK